MTAATSLSLDLPRTDSIRQYLNHAAIAQTAAAAKALGDPKRVTIAMALRNRGKAVRP
jgi:hypothetical protein